MYSHVTVGTDDLERAGAFYDSVLATLGIARRFAHDAVIAYQGDAPGHFFVVRPYDGGAASAGNGTHVAFLAPSRSHVDAFHAAALAAGGVDEGAPGLRPHYHEHYYGAYARDLDGNKLQAASHEPE